MWTNSLKHMLTVHWRASASEEGPAHHSSSLHSHWFSPGARTEHGQVRDHLLQRVCLLWDSKSAQRESRLFSKDSVVLGLNTDLSMHLRLLPLPLSWVTQVAAVDWVTWRTLLGNPGCDCACLCNPVLGTWRWKDQEFSILIHVVGWPMGLAWLAGETASKIQVTK